MSTDHASGQQPDSAGRYDVSAALADVAASRNSVADRLITPWWYHPVLGLCLSAIVLVNALHLHSIVKLVVALAAAASMGLLVGAYQRITGLWVDLRNLGPTSRLWWLAYVGVLAIVVGAPLLLPTFTDRPLPTWLAITFTAVALVSTIVLGRAIDAAMRAEIRAGAATAPKAR